jgi:hypothetical protein
VGSRARAGAVEGRRGRTILPAFCQPLRRTDRPPTYDHQAVATYFHVHRRDGLAPGHVIALEHYAAFPPELEAHLRVLFPDGLTRHGATYLGLIPERFEDSKQNGWREAIFEFVRRSAAPDAPSRFQSVFACASLDEAQIFRRSVCGGEGSIYAVEAGDAFRVNMSLLNESASYLAVFEAAHSYWRGERGFWPEAWEHLLIPPVTVGSTVA